MAKLFLKLIDTRLPATNKSHRIFNRSIRKVSFRCTENISRIIKGHNKKVTQIKRHHQLECNCRIKTECPLDGDCRKEDVIYKSAALTTFQHKEVYLGLPEGKSKKQGFYNHTQSFCNENYSNSTTLFSYVSKIKKTKKETPTIVWEIIRTAAPYTNNKDIFYMSP